MSDDTSPISPTSDAAAESTAGEARPQRREMPDYIPQWVRDQISEANQEAAKYRVKAREAKDEAQHEAGQQYAAKIAELSDAKAAIAAELQTAKLENSKLRAALNAGIPGESAADFADLLKGETDEDIAAHAEKVKDLFLGVAPGPRPDRAVDPSQGMGPGTGSAEDFGSFLLSKLT